VRSPIRGLLTCVARVALSLPTTLHAQAGPPFLTNDPGTPGDANWEINLASMQSVTRGGAVYQVPQIDLNYGVGERIQLTYEIPYEIATGTANPTHTGWGNANPGIKWRFLDQGEGGWQMSVFPQAETGVSSQNAERGLGAAGTRYLLPVEITKNIGAFAFDAEAGYYAAAHAPRVRILGFVVGHDINERLELDAEIYDVRAEHAAPHSTTLDVGGRYKLRPGIIALFMGGRSLDGDGDGQPTFIGYVGIQILLSDNGRRFTR